MPFTPDPFVFARGQTMGGKPHSEPDFTTVAHFLKARTGLDGPKEVIILDFEMVDFDPPLTSMGMKCSLNDVRKLVHTCLAALKSFGDQPASVLLKVLKQGKG
jgi:hypothetical protein